MDLRDWDLAGGVWGENIGISVVFDNLPGVKFLLLMDLDKSNIELLVDVHLRIIVKRNERFPKVLLFQNVPFKALFDQSMYNFLERIDSILVRL